MAPTGALEEGILSVRLCGILFKRALKMSSSSILKSPGGFYFEQASKQACNQASIQPSKHATKQASIQTSKQASRQAGKQASKQVSKQAGT